MAGKWQTPRAPVHPPDSALPRARAAVPPRPRSLPAWRPLETIALCIGAASVFTTMFSAGTAFLMGAILALPALGLGQLTGRRGAVLLAWAGLGFAVVAGVAWMALGADAWP